MAGVHVVVTGRPGVGKTTLVHRVVERLRDAGVRVSGFYCPEVRRAGRRVGFLIRGLGSAEGLEAWLARVDGCDGPRVGRYTTCRAAEEVARQALLGRDADLLVIDEVGPMELRLRGVREAIIESLASGKPALLVAHYRLSDPEVLRLLSGAKRFYVTLENRDKLVDEVYKEVMGLLGR